MIHGGFWRRRYGRAIQWPAARDLQARGWAVWNVEYRRLGGGGGWPQTFEDVAAAIDRLAGHADGLDLERVVALGHSAGGQLALWAAARAGLPDGAPGAGPRVRPCAALAQAGVADLRHAHALRLAGGVVGELLGGGPDDVPDRYALADPAERLPLGVPVTLVHGDADGTVPLELSVRYAEAARAAGDDVDLVVVPGEGHREHLEPGSRSWTAAVERLNGYRP